MIQFSAEEYGKITISMTVNDWAGCSHHLFTVPQQLYLGRPKETNQNLGQFLLDTSPQFKSRAHYVIILSLTVWLSITIKTTVYFLLWDESRIYNFRPTSCHLQAIKMHKTKITRQHYFKSILRSQSAAVYNIHVQLQYNFCGAYWDLTLLYKYYVAIVVLVLCVLMP